METCRLESGGLQEKLVTQMGFVDVRRTKPTDEMPVCHLQKATNHFKVVECVSRCCCWSASCWMRILLGNRMSGSTKPQGKSAVETNVQKIAAYLHGWIGPAPKLKTCGVAA